MSRSITTIAGDTFDLVARKAYGDESQAFRLHSANPGIYFPSELNAGLIPPGSTLAVPDLPDGLDDRLTSTRSDGPDDLGLLLNGKRFRFWTTVEITRSLDAMDTVQLSAPFEADAEGFKESFQPLSYRPLVVTVGGTPLFSGTMVDVRPAISEGRKTIEVAGYSRPGVLNDCTAPASAAPLEFNKLKLTDIAGILAGHFGIAVDFQADPGAEFDRVSANPPKKILSFLTELATQRNLVISSSTNGDLLFQQSRASGIPVASLKQGEQPLESVRPSFRPQQYFSHVTGIQPSTLSFLPGTQVTEVNARLKGVIRPMAFQTPDTDGADATAAVKSKLGRMFGEVVSYTITLPSWRSPKGPLWEPNQIIELEAPDAMVYAPYKFVIRSVRFSARPDSRTATLNLILPGALNGEAPDSFPWDS